MQKFALEKLSAFPYIAWTTIFVCTLCVINLILNLQNAVTDLQQSTDELEATIQTLPHSHWSTTTHIGS